MSLDPAPPGGEPLLSITIDRQPDPMLPPGGAAKLRRLHQMDEDAFALVPPFDAVHRRASSASKQLSAWIVCSNIRAGVVSG